MVWCAMSTETGTLVPGGCSASWISRGHPLWGSSGFPTLLSRHRYGDRSSGGDHSALPARLLCEWPVGHQPFGMAIAPSDGRVFVANSGATTNPTVSVVNPATGSVASLATSGTSDLVAVDSAARRLYSSNANGTLDVFDLANGTRIATVAVGAGLGVAVDPATRRVYVACGTGLFAAVDGFTYVVVDTRCLPCGQFWSAVALDPGMHRVYVSNIDQTKPTLE